MVGTVNHTRLALFASELPPSEDELAHVHVVEVDSELWPIHPQNVPLRSCSSKLMEFTFDVAHNDEMSV